MSRQYMTLEAANIAAADTEIDLVALGATAAEDRNVEAGKSRIRRIWAAIAADGAAVGAGSVWIRLHGSGIGRECKLMVGSYGGTLITTGGQSFILAELTDLDIPVVAGSAIQIGAEMNLDLGTVSVGVTLEIE